MSENKGLFGGSCGCGGLFFFFLILVIIFCCCSFGRGFGKY
ncbi:hypothetical protein [Brassicibacter mesophilus]